MLYKKQIAYIKNKEKNTAGNREGLPTVNYSCFNFKFVSHNNSSIDEAPTASAAFKTM